MMRSRATGGPGAIASFAAAVFTIGITAFTFLVAAAVLLPAPYGLGGPMGAVNDPSASPTASTALPRGSAVPRTSGTPAGSATPPPSAVLATPAPSPTPAPRLERIRASAPVMVDGRAAGRVTVQALRSAARPGIEVDADERVMVATVRLTATARLPFDTAHWQLEDASGDRWDPVPDAPTDPLGSGTLAPAGTRTGTVAFVLPRDRMVRSVILTDGVGTDLVVFARREPSS